MDSINEIIIKIRKYTKLKNELNIMVGRLKNIIVYMSSCEKTLNDNYIVNNDKSKLSIRFDDLLKKYKNSYNKLLNNVIPEINNNIVILRKRLNCLQNNPSI